MKRAIARVLPFVALLTLAAACGDDSNDSASTNDPAPASGATDDTMANDQGSAGGAPPPAIPRGSATPTASSPRSRAARPRARSAA
ncbi:MAG: hypothetical protein ACRD0A_08280 [Acidimicrobiales bacterium]